MSKIKLTKGELKRQRDALSQFRHFLPTLQLKKQQLQMKILQARKELLVKEADLKTKLSLIESWIGLLADDQVDIFELIEVESIQTTKINIAGARVVLLGDVTFVKKDYDFFIAPLWIDVALKRFKELIIILIEIEFLNNQIRILNKELRVTTQRVNLFEKIKIPECVENIRKIRIYLGDQQANAVGIGKVAKKKIEARDLVEV